VAQSGPSSRISLPTWLFESMQPSFEHLSPAFENLFGGLWNKVKSVAKGAVNLARKGIAAVGKIIPLGGFSTS
jgi:hypothetical protein